MGSGKFFSKALTTAKGPLQEELNAEKLTATHLVHGNTEHTQISDCQLTGGALVGGKTMTTKIQKCQVVDAPALIIGFASNTHILDFAAFISMEKTDETEIFHGGIAGGIFNKSLIERCFVSGNFSIRKRIAPLGGITGRSESSSIRQCGIGLITLNSNSPPRIKRIAFHESSTIFNNNAAIDLVAGKDDPNGPDGKTVAAARFNQRFFEGSLGWDFDTVWQWDATNNRPALRFGANSSQAIDPAASNATAANGTPLQDLLTRQVQANIWL